MDKEMRKLINNFLCKIFGHDPYPIPRMAMKQVFDCKRCGKQHTLDE